VPYRIEEVAERANVPEDFVRRLIDLGALPGEEAGLGIAEVRRSRLLYSWAAAGLSVAVEQPSDRPEWPIGTESSDPGRGGGARPR